MRNQGLASILSLLTLSASILQGYSLPQHRYSAEDFGRKFGSAPIDNISNDIEESHSALAKQDEGSLLTTVLELGMKFVPMLIDALSGSSGPSQTDRIEGIDLNGEDPFSMRNLAFLGLKLFLAVASGSTGSNSIEKNDNFGPMQPLVGAIIGTLTGSNDPTEVAVMAKQATEVINLVVTLVEALTTSMSQRSFPEYSEYSD